MVHVTIDGVESTQRLFTDYDLQTARSYDDEKLLAMLDWLYFAQQQYASFR